MAKFSRQTLLEAGLNLVLNAATGSDTFDNPEGKGACVVVNGSGVSVTCSVAVVTTPPASALTGQPFGLVTKPAFSLVVPAGGRAIVPPLPPSVFNNTNGEITLSVAPFATVTLSPVVLP